MKKDWLDKAIEKWVGAVIGESDCWYAGFLSLLLPFALLRELLSSKRRYYRKIEYEGQRKRTTKRKASAWNGKNIIE